MRKVTRGQKVQFYLAAAISLTTFLVYLSSLRNGFVDEWDDNWYVIDNLNIHSLSLSFFRWAFGYFYAGNWHPLTWISHALDYAVWGLNPLGHHLTSNIVHALNTFIVVLLVARLIESTNSESPVPSPHSRFAFHDSPFTLIAAGTTGLLFGLHPIHVESVAWVSERKDLLCALFFLLSTLTYMKYCREGGASSHPSRSRHSREGGNPGQRDLIPGQARDNNQSSGTKVSLFLNKTYLLSLAFFILALLSKPMAVSLPAVLLLLDWYPFGRITSLKTFRTVFVEKFPFVLLSLISSIVTIMAQKAEGAMELSEFLPLSVRLLVAAKSVVAYLWKIILPLNLLPFYPYPQNVSVFSPEYVLSIALVAGITAVCLMAVKRQKVWLSVWCYYMVTLMPVLGIVQVGRQSMADRYAYLPSLGIFLMIGLLVARLVENVYVQKTRGALVKLSGATMAFFVVSFMAFLTFNQIGIWKNSFTLWTFTIGKGHEKVLLAYINRGIAFARVGEIDKAIEDFDKIIAFKMSDVNVYSDPNYYKAYYNRGLALNKKGQSDLALADLDRAIALNPSYYLAYFNRALLFEKMGQFTKAIEDLNKTITLDPSAFDAYSRLGVLYGRSGSYDKAIEVFNKSIAGNPKDDRTYYYRGYTYTFINQHERALEDYSKAIELNQTNARAYVERGNLYLKKGNRQLAASDFQTACNLHNEDGCNALQTPDKRK